MEDGRVGKKEIPPSSEYQSAKPTTDPASEGQKKAYDHYPEARWNFRGISPAPEKSLK